VLGQYIAQMLQRQGKKIGVEIDIVQVEWGTIIRDTNERNYEISHTTDIWRPDPAEYKAYDQDIKRRAGVSNPELKKMLLEALTLLDHPKRVALYHGIEKKIAEHAPVI
jgi:ABC-type transport system substrate-binding protein